MDSLTNQSETKTTPRNVATHDNSSVASSLTDASIQSNDTSFSDLSITSQVTDKSTVSVGTKNTLDTPRSKYELTKAMVETIGKAAIEEGLTPAEVENRIISYQDLKFNEAKSRALIEIDKFKKAYTFKIPDKPNLTTIHPRY